jgi:hypothetical protein
MYLLAGCCSDIPVWGAKLFNGMPTEPIMTEDYPGGILATRFGACVVRKSVHTGVVADMASCSQIDFLRMKRQCRLARL